MAWEKGGKSFDDFMTGIWLLEHPFFVWKTRALSIALHINVGKLWEFGLFGVSV
jgi:hypothetical protein